MNRYIDITLLPDADIGLHFLWEKLYRQIHLGLVEIQEANGSVPVGVAFPGYDAQQCLLGNKLRLLAESEALLERFNAAQWLSRFSDYIHLTGIRPVPERIRAYACYPRIQPKSSKARLARRKARRENIGFEQALAALENFSERRADAPYVWMNSQTNGERFCLFVGYAEKPALVQAGFSAYGLSRISSVPIF
ncbi:type I-F CRISPR-associated endoribonuclease Cas6/Csy4 [Candidatus Methylospira mobilis]|uniref:Type I-F CRISPR-associated endoribonuclease Cas6/Csy4 n=1 Tax=Candidatus Methylospira mobilis TaxID=1808979 RepID=A0A5Q0BNT1_9GAMM|nr:type I-F CRISPR-associated endoribonuclease Cas6/Csy4 [Candidatus Methylospira mobilis]QFY44832.1 type I-F CRISPR-associated endoribonuclease Cas6/Csy4 [Candidatus Methylospira mobilis]WNV05623.1 type I-F CRISPR-associated endoribonuclease Cas6/Csy4 [Candidatus Methylospira mobilis]